jgi:hypothetical protein
MLSSDSRTYFAPYQTKAEHFARRLFLASCRSSRAGVARMAIQAPYHALHILAARVEAKSRLGDAAQPVMTGACRRRI